MKGDGMGCSFKAVKIVKIDENDFFNDYKELAKENHYTKIKYLEQQSYLDRIEFTVELVSRTAKKNNP